MTRAVFLFILVGLFGLAVTAPASDLAKEKRWAKHIKEGLLEGEPVTLNDGKNDFFSIYTAADTPKETGIILLHGIGVHPDWPMVINPLRVELPAKGWSVLSLQLPILENSAKPEQYKPLMKEVPARIIAGIKYLSKKGIKKIVIIAHSMGAEMASYYIAGNKPVLSGYIGIGMNKSNTVYLKKINLPVLDLYGEADLPGVVNSSKDRKQAAVSNKDYQQIVVPGADHFFNGHEKKLMNEVIKWLGR